MSEAKKWRIKVIDRGSRVEWALERARPIYDETILYAQTLVGIEWEWESGGFARNPMAARLEAEAAKEALELAEKQEQEAVYIELED